jgi:hypothetical protein
MLYACGLRTFGNAEVASSILAAPSMLLRRSDASSTPRTSPSNSNTNLEVAANSSHRWWQARPQLVVVGEIDPDISVRFKN